MLDATTIDVVYCQKQRVLFATTGALSITKFFINQLPLGVPIVFGSFIFARSAPVLSPRDKLFSR